MDQLVDDLIGLDLGGGTHPTFSCELCGIERIVNQANLDAHLQGRRHRAATRAAAVAAGAPAEHSCQLCELSCNSALSLATHLAGRRHRAAAAAQPGAAQAEAPLAAAAAAPPGVAAATPPLGYNSWNAFHTNLDDNVMRKVADALVSTGLAAAGYSFVNMDDGWQVDRYANGTIVADPARFPYGIRAVADYVHGLGLRFGVYTSQTQFTCQERPGSYEFETVDIDTYCAWGVDYLKVCARMCVGVVNTSRFRVSLGPSTSPRPPPPSPPAD